jgi:hypothetical protein
MLSLLPIVILTQSSNLSLESPLLPSYFPPSIQTVDISKQINDSQGSPFLPFGKPKTKPSSPLFKGQNPTLAQVVVPGAAIVVPTPSPSPTPVPPIPQEVLQLQQVRPLPGQLDQVPVLNSNSPEVVLTEGILTSSFPSLGKAVPEAHLNYAFNGRFDIFAHHIARAATPAQTRTLFFGVILHNPSVQPVQVDLIQAATYLTSPDARFVELPNYVEDPLGTIYAGPGSRVMGDILRGRRRGAWPSSFTIPPQQSYLLTNLPIPVSTNIPSSNGRSLLMRLMSNGPIYAASLAMRAPLNPDGSERFPQLEEWETLLQTSALAGPRDIAPTPLGRTFAFPFYYGRVSGVAKGSRWEANLTDNQGIDKLTIPQPGQAFSYPLSTLNRGTFGTGQIQSAPIVARYSDTAYLAHGNYGIEYKLNFPLYNPTDQTQTITVSLQTPLKQDRIKGGLVFLDPPAPNVFFRGTVKLKFMDDGNVEQVRYAHLVQRRGQQGEPLVTLKLRPNERRSVKVELLYPPDSTPPQVLTVRNIDSLSVGQAP